MQIGRLSELGPRSVWDILDDAFDVYRERWVLLCGATAIVSLPLYGLYLALTSGPAARLASVAETSGNTSVLLEALGPFLGRSFAVYPLLLIALVLQAGVTSVIVRDLLTERVVTSYRQTFQIIGKRWWPLLLGAVCFALAVAVGMCAFFIGALYAASLLAFVPQLIVLEGRGVADAFRRSQTLCRPDWGRVLGMMVLVAALTVLLQAGLSAILRLLWEIVPAGGDAGANAAREQITGQALSSIAVLLLAPIGAIASTLLYYDLRVRREGFDLVAQAQAVQYPLAPDPFGEVSSEEARERLRRDAARAARRARRSQ